MELLYDPGTTLHAYLESFFLGIEAVHFALFPLGHLPYVYQVFGIFADAFIYAGEGAGS